MFKVGDKIIYIERDIIYNTVYHKGKVINVVEEKGETLYHVFFPNWGMGHGFFAFENELEKDANED